MFASSVMDFLLMYGVICLKVVDSKIYLGCRLRKVLVDDMDVGVKNIQ